MAAERNGIGADGTMVNISKYHPKIIRNTYSFDRLQFDLNNFKKTTFYGRKKMLAFVEWQKRVNKSNTSKCMY